MQVETQPASKAELCRTAFLMLSTLHSKLPSYETNDTFLIACNFLQFQLEMVFACQNDSFQKSLISRVISCTKGTEPNAHYFEVICEDSIFFPEGGGQPFDTGFIDQMPVLNVQRKGNDAVIYVEKPIEVGQEVKQVIDWERRFDHMQQHSGQHLITAIFNNEFKIDTTAWWLGEKVCHIELDTKCLTPEQINHVELLANQKILEQVPVRVIYCKEGDKCLEGARTRGLPKDIADPVRIVEIVGVESDLCCGTHVNNLAQLQSIKLLYSEKGKKNKTNLFFLCGGRVLKNFTACLHREELLSKLLKGEPSSHSTLVEKLQQNLKLTTKKLNSALKELADCEANKFREIRPQPIYYAFHNKNADSDYLNYFWRLLKDDVGIENTFFMLAAGDETGNLLLQGNKEDLTILGPQIADLMGGKGMLQDSRYQARVTKLSNFAKAREILKKHFAK